MIAFFRHSAFRPIVAASLVGGAVALLLVGFYLLFA